jgi:hypothetical protein
MELGANCAVYAIQEFLSTGEHGFWYTICCLDIISAAGSAVAKKTGACASVGLILGKR